MFRWLVGAVGWVVSVVLRLAFVVCVVGLVAGFALGGGLPTTTADLSGVVGTVGNASPLGDTGSTGSVGGLTGDVGVRNESGMGSGAVNRSAVPSSNSGELNGTRLEYLVHDGINRRRAQHGESNLSFDTGLRSVARYHSVDMANRSYFSHVGPDGETLTDRYHKFEYQCRVPMSGLRYATGGENILYTYYDTPVRTDNRTVRYDTQRELARGIVDGWMNSTEHRKNLLEPYWNNEGIGIDIQQVDGRTRVYATEEFC